MVGPFLILDRYLIRLGAGNFLGLVAIIVTILSLETLPRLVARLGSLDRKLDLVFQSLASLLPEYLAIAIPLALFLAVALAFRQLALRGELEIFAAAGIGPVRMLRVPMLVGVAGGMILILVSGYVQPAGERRLDSIGRGASAGNFGLVFPAGVANRLASHTFLYFDSMSPAGDIMRGILVSEPDRTITASSASLVDTTNGSVRLLFRDGIVQQRSIQPSGVLHFDSLDVTLHPGLDPAHRIRSSRDRLQRLDLHHLLTATTLERGINRQMAMASFWARIANALLCAFLPLLAYALGVPAKRSRSAYGLAVGLIVIILFWRGSGLIEDHYAPIGWQTHLLLLASIGAAAIWLIRCQDRLGAVEEGLRRATMTIADSICTILPFRRTRSIEAWKLRGSVRSSTAAPQ
jgi:lipopolysaccharide export system permease protein